MAGVSQGVQSIRNDFHVNLASAVASELQYQKANYFYFLGKVEDWVGGTYPSIPDTNSALNDYSIRSNALYFSRILPGDVSIMTKRYDWVGGVVYPVWDHTKAMNGEPFFVITSDYNVYKCLSNNGGVTSTEMPTGRDYNVTITSDGYIWKYMYNIPEFKQVRFMSSVYIPVQKALSESFYNKGAVEKVFVVNSGSGYDYEVATSIVISGTTTGSGATGKIHVNAAGTITSVTITNGGSGYTSGANVAVTTTSGRDAVLTPIIAGGVITGVNIVEGGFLYSENENLDITIGGAKIVPVLDFSGAIIDLTIVHAGAGYNGSVTCTVTSTGGGTGAYGNPTALVNAIVYQGSIVQANIIDPGVNYPFGYSTYITVTGDGSGAEFKPIIVDGKIVDVVVINSGIGYTDIKLTINTSGNGSGAVLSPSIRSSDFTSDQFVVEQTAVDGAIYHVQMVEKGNNYSASTTITIDGDGTGATASATIVSGRIDKITMLTYGSGYTFANIVIADPGRTYVGTVVDASAYVTLPPVGGHGYDAVAELISDTVAFNNTLRRDIALNLVAQDYRQYGIVKNPTSLFTGKLYTNQTAIVTYDIQVDDASDMIIDEILVLGKYRYRVIYIQDKMVKLQLLNSKLIVPSGTLVAETDGSRTYSVTRLISSPTINKYSGRLLFSSNEDAFSFNDSQGIVIKTFITL